MSQSFNRHPFEAIWTMKPMIIQWDQY